METIALWKAVFLGALQGATEFLPVSSSGHLVIAQSLLDIRIENGGLAAYDVCLHIGTLLAIVAVFWRELLQILLSFTRRISPDATTQAPSSTGMTDAVARRLGIYLIIGTIPAVIIGFSFKKFFENLFEAPLPAAFMLLITGVILWTTRFAKDRDVALPQMKWWHSLVIGIAQAVAIIPGISRSGSTISGGLFLGLDRTLAARFAFLLAVPAIGGAAILEIDKLKLLSQSMLPATLIGTAVAAITGVICIKWLLGIVRRGHFSWFAYYCWAAGVAAIGYFGCHPAV